MKFIINCNNVFFTVYDDININTVKLIRGDCLTFPSYHIMLDHVSLITGADYDEIIGQELIIRMRDNKPVCIDARGCVEYIVDTLDGVDSFIIDYVV